MYGDPEYDKRANYQCYKVYCALHRYISDESGNTALESSKNDVRRVPSLQNSTVDDDVVEEPEEHQSGSYQVEAQCENDGEDRKDESHM